MDEISTQVKHQETEEILKAAKPDQHYFMRNMDKVDHSEKLREGIQETRTTMITRFHSSERKLDSLTYKPHHSLLVSAFQERNLNITAQKRQEDTRKKGSLLYNKLKNAALIKKAEKDLAAAGLSTILRDLSRPGEQLESDQELFDMAAFMSADAKVNVQIAALFRGSDKSALMDMIVQRLHGIEIGKFRMNNDQELGGHAADLELLTRQVEVFDRLSKENGYLETLDERTRAEVEKKISQLRSIACYYQARKDVMLDSYYQSHLNEELTADITKLQGKEPKGDKEKEELAQKKALAQKLLKAHVAGRIMMQENGIDADLIARMGTPRFADQKAAKEEMKTIEATCADKTAQKKALAKACNNALQSDGAYEYFSAIRLTCKDENFQQELVRQIDANAETYQGEEFMKDGYQEPVCDEIALKEYLKELEQISVTDVAFSNYGSVIKNFSKNHEICAKVEFLHRQICRALAKGYQIDDKTLVSVRAKTNAFRIMDLVSTEVNYQIHQRPDLLLAGEEAWNEALKEAFTEESVPGLFSGKYRNYVGKARDLLENCEKVAKDQDQAKEDLIRNSWYLMAKGNQIPKEELRQRKMEFNRNAVIYDFLSGVNEWIKNGAHALQYRLTSSGRVGFGVGNLAAAGQSGAEVRRICDLANGKASEKYQLDKELIGRVKECPIESMDVRNFSTLFDNFEKKYIAQQIAAKHLREIDSDVIKIHQEAKDLPQENDQVITDLPKEYHTEEELKRDTQVIGHLANTYGGRLGSIAQTPFSAGRNAFSIEELTNLTESEVEAILNSYESSANKDLRATEQFVRNSVYDFVPFEWRLSEHLPILLHRMPADQIDMRKMVKLNYILWDEERENQGYWDREDHFYQEHPEWREEHQQAKRRHFADCAMFREEFKNEILKLYWGSDGEHLLQFDHTATPEQNYRRKVEVVSAAYHYINMMRSIGDKGWSKHESPLTKKEKEKAASLRDKLMKKENKQAPVKLFGLIEGYDLRELNFKSYEDILQLKNMTNVEFLLMAENMDEIIDGYRSGEDDVTAQERIDRVRTRVRFLKKIGSVYRNLSLVMRSGLGKEWNVSDLLALEGADAETKLKNYLRHSVSTEMREDVLKAVRELWQTRREGIVPGADMETLFREFRPQG